MKKSFLISAFGLLLGLGSCSQLEKSETISNILTENNENVPQEVITTVNSIYPNSTVSYATLVSNQLFEAKVSTNGNESILVLNHRGKIKGNFETITQADLPSTVTDYLTNTYAGYTYIRGVKDTTGTNFYYHFHINYNSLNYSLSFDEAGNLLESYVMTGNQKGLAILESDLPQTILDYLSANYAGYTYLKGRLDSSNTNAYHLHISLNSTEYSLNFNLEGGFISVNTGSFGNGNSGLALTDLPEIVQNYLSTNYEGFVYERGFQNSANSNYHLHITYNSEEYSIYFDVSGNLISESVIPAGSKEGGVGHRKKKGKRG